MLELKEKKIFFDTVLSATKWVDVLKAYTKQKAGTEIKFHGYASGSTNAIYDSIFVDGRENDCHKDNYMQQYWDAIYGV